jgi:rubrerythrin
MAMPDRAVLQEQFSQMLATAQAAAAEYHRLAAGADDAAKREKLQRLAREESRHVGLAERLLEIVNE